MDAPKAIIKSRGGEEFLIDASTGLENCTLGEQIKSLQEQINTKLTALVETEKSEFKNGRSKHAISKYQSYLLFFTSIVLIRWGAI